MNIINDKNTMLCPIENNINTIELTVHTCCYWVLDLLCVNLYTTPDKNGPAFHVHSIMFQIANVIITSFFVE